jgi:hypothetical protein
VRALCDGSKPNRSAVAEISEEVVAPELDGRSAVAIQPALEKLGCTPNKSADARTVSKPAASSVLKPADDRAAARCRAWPAKAALQAKKRGYVLAVG